MVLPSGLGTQLMDNVNMVVSTFYDQMTPANEDCKEHVVLHICRELIYSRGLTINVVRPANATSTSKLPVAVVGNVFTLANCHDGSRR